MSGNCNVDSRIYGNTRIPITQVIGRAVTAEIDGYMNDMLTDRVVDHITPMLDSAVHTAIERLVQGDAV